MFVFISYKSEDANLVRRVTEQLVACGLEVWFNEYRIMVADYERFQDAIDDGLARATHAVVFTNDRWAEADWCRYEMTGLLSHIPDPSRIVEVAIPSEAGPGRKFPGQLGRRAIEFRGDPRHPTHAAVHEAVAAILDRFGLRTDMTPLPDSEPRPVWLPTSGVTFDPAPFQLNQAKTIRQVQARTLQSDTVLGLRTIVYRLAAADVDITMDVYATNYESPISRLAISETGSSDDRAVYEAYLRYARQWLPSEHGHFRHIEYRPKGLHLVFVGGTSQIALTYVSRMEGETGPKTTWERRYAVRIPNPLGDSPGELAFVFSVGLAGDEAQQERAFSRLAPWFDAVVTSADVRWPTRAQSLAMAVPGALAKTAIAAGVGWLGWDMLVRHMPAWRLAIFAAVFGLAAGDLASYLFSGPYRALLASLRPAIEDLRPIGSPARFISGLWFHLFTAPYLNIGLLVRGLIVAGAYAVGYLTIPLLAGWALLFSKKAPIAPPAWLAGHWTAVGLAAAGLFGFAASQFTRKLVKARYLKTPKKAKDESAD